MSLTDWIVLGVTLLAIVVYGVWKSGRNQNIDQYLVGGPLHALVHCGSIGYGHAGQRHHFFIGARAGLFRRDALCAILLRPAAGHDRALHHLCAHIQPA